MIKNKGNNRRRTSDQGSVDNVTGQEKFEQKVLIKWPSCDDNMRIKWPNTAIDQIEVDKVESNSC